MVATYTTVARVVTQLGWVTEDGDRPTLDENSIPTSAEVTELIEEAESDLESITRNAWTTKTKTDEIHSSPERYFRRYSQGLYIQMGRRNIISLTKLEIYDSDGEWTDLVATGEEGEGPQDGDWYLLKEQGLLFIHNTYPSTFYEGSVKLTYTYGQTTVEPAIRRATTLLAAVYAVEAGFDFVYTLREGLDGMNNEQKSTRWEKRAMEIAGRFKEVTPLFQF